MKQSLDPAGRQGTAKGEVLVLKGSRRGLRLVLDEEAPFETLIAEALRRLSASRRFFAGAPVEVSAGRRRATWGEWMQLVAALESCGLQVRLQHAEAPGEGSAPGGAGAIAGQRRGAGPRAVIGPAELPEDPDQALEWPPPVNGRRHAATPGVRTLLVRRTLRSGQRVAYDGNVVVLGDVNPGAEVIASGDVVVVGALRGVVHAGARGDERAVVVASRFAPLQLRIAHRVARAPDEGAARHKGPELAWIRDEAVEVRPYDTTEEGPRWQDAQLS